jgi:hypothetical protein
VSHSKRTEIYEIKVTEAKGYHLTPTSRFGRKVRRTHGAYECLNPDCHWDFRVVWPPSDPKVAEHGKQVTCPKCASLYVEWLSYDMDPLDVFLDTDEEWAQVPMGKVRVLESRIEG